MTSLHSPLTITDLLRDANLLQYEPAFLKQGADDIHQLMELSDQDLRELIQLTGMDSKPFHVMRLMKILGRSNKPPSSTASEADTELTTGHMSYHAGSTTGNGCCSMINTDVDGDSNDHSATALVNTHTVTVYATQIDAASDPTLPGGTAGTTTGSEIYPPPEGMALTNHTMNASLFHSHEQQLVMSQEQQHQLRPTGTHPLNPRQPLTTSAHSINSAVATVSSHDPFLGVNDERFHFVKSVDVLNSLLDDSVPIQKRLDPPLFSPNIWDSGRMEIIREASKLHNVDTCDSTAVGHEPLGSFEQSMNEASYQLCLYDPTLLVRKDELFLLANKCVVHSSCKRKASDVASSGSSRKSRKVDRSSANLNRGADGKFTASFELNYEMREKEMQALDKLLNENTVQQKTKQAQLMAAQQKKDYSTALKLQEEISSLGQIHHHLRSEMSQIRKTQRRSVRNQELKHKKELQNKATANSNGKISGNDSPSRTSVGSLPAKPPLNVVVTTSTQQPSPVSFIEDNGSSYSMSASTCFDGMQAIDSNCSLINTTAASTPPPLLLDTSTTTAHLYRTE